MRRHSHRLGSPAMLWLLLCVVLLLWIIGWGFGVAGNFIHVLLLVALILLILNFGMGRKTV